MILVGQFDSPYVRRVAVSLRVLGFAYEHDQRSVFGDFDSMRGTNPLGRVPSLILDDGRVVIDSAAILDWLDRQVGPGRALLPTTGTARDRALHLIALSTGANDKLIALNYERLIRPSALRWPEWTARCLTQIASAFAALDREAWPWRLDQAQITIGCTIGYARLSAPDVMPEGRYTSLDALWTQLRGLPEFAATDPGEYRIPRRE
jgi:glutathione S-transferase